jgi:hypothetical protein
VVGRVDVRGQESLSLVWVKLESHKEREARRVEESQPWQESLEVFGSCNSLMLKRSPSFCMSQKPVGAVYNDVQIKAATDSHHPPNRWPWPHRWACVGTGCRQD